MKRPFDADSAGRRAWTALALVLALAAFPPPALSAQEGSFIRGAVLDGEPSGPLPSRAGLSARNWQNLPERVSLKKYAPIPGDQLPYGTCVAWATAYGARTISESIIAERQQTRTITGNVYSPVFVYKSINSDPSCLSGTQIFTALDLMKERGAPRMLDIERSTDFVNVPLEAFAGARTYPIAGYVTLFRTDRAGRGNSAPGYVQTVKKALAGRKPVIIGMNTPESFVHALEVWRPEENPHHYYGGHALVVVGYDDSRHGGAFEVLNSWGKKWGNGGFIWIPYEVFGQWVSEAYEIIENLAAWSDTSRFSGFARIEASGGEMVPAAYRQDGCYRAVLPAGADWRLLLGNTDPAWLYAFSVRPEGVRQVFPPENGSTVPVLDYAESYLSLPGENEWMPRAESPDPEYLVLFYAKEELNPVQIRARLGKARGNIAARTAQAAGTAFLGAGEAEFTAGEIRFSVESDNSLGVFALIISLERD